MFRPARTLEIDWPLLVAAGSVNGASVIHKFGRNSDVDTTIAETVWEGGSRYPWPTSACVISVQSTSASDDVGGAGATSVTLFGLLEDYSQGNEVITLDGTTSVSSACAYTRVHRMWVEEAGSNGSNAGEISACGNGSALALINPGNNQTLMAVYTIPACTSGFLTSWTQSINQIAITGNCEFILNVRPEGSVFRTTRILDVKGDGATSFQETFEYPIKLYEKTDIEITACPGQANTDVDAAFDVLLISDG